MKLEGEGGSLPAVKKKKNGMLLQLGLTLRKCQDTKENLDTYMSSLPNFFWNYANFKIIHYYFHQLSTYKNFINHHLVVSLGYSTVRTELLPHRTQVYSGQDFLIIGSQRMIELRCETRHLKDILSTIQKNTLT